MPVHAPPPGWHLSPVHMKVAGYTWKVEKRKRCLWPRSQLRSHATPLFLDHNADGQKRLPQRIGRFVLQTAQSGVFSDFFDHPPNETGMYCVVVVRLQPSPSALEATMKVAITKPLFAWDALEDSPSLQSLRVLLEAIPDHALLDSLRNARGKGRDDYPVEVLWGTLVLAIALRHVSTDACL